MIGSPFNSLPKADGGQLAVNSIFNFYGQLVSNAPFPAP